MKNLSCVFLLLYFVVGCAKPDSESRPERPIVFNNEAKDIQITVDPDKQVPLVSPEGHMNTAELFEHFYIMQKLGERTRKTYWARDSQTHFLNFYKTAGTHSLVPFAESPYALMLTAESQGEYLKATENLDDFFEIEKSKFRLIMNELKTNFKVPETSTNLVGIIDLIIKYVNKLETKISASNLDPSIQNAVLSGLYDEFWEKLPFAKSIVMELETSPNLESSVQKLKEIIAAFEFELTPDEIGQIENIEDIGARLNKENLRHKDAFVILVRLWDMLSDEERLEHFGEMSKELYDYLNSKGRKKIECLKNNACKGLMTSIEQKFFVRTAIKNYGVRKLRDEINDSLVQEFKAETGSVATKLIGDLPDYFIETFEQNMDKELENFLRIRREYPVEVMNRLQAWFDNRFHTTSVPALESRYVNFKSDGSFVGNENIETGADTLGAALLASAQLFTKARTKLRETDSDLFERLAIGRLGQILAYGGFDLANGLPFQSLNRSFKNGKPFNLNDGLNLPHLFAMNSPVKVAYGFKVSKNQTPKDWNVVSQARLLDGFSHKISNFKDWGKAPIDEYLGKYQAQDFVPDIQTSELNIPAFPKDAFVALSFGNAASIIANLNAKGSPLLILCAGDEPNVWNESDYNEQTQDAKCHINSGKAGIVNVRNGKREPHINTYSHAKFLEALLSFLNYSDVLAEKTFSSYLHKKVNGSSAIDDYLETKNDIKNLAMAMTNFISSELLDARGNMIKSYHYNSEKPHQGKANFRDHLQSIGALVKAAKYFNAPIYERAAVRAYYGLNNNFYNPTTQFYKTGSPQVSTIDLALALETLEHLEGWITDPDSRNQLNSLLSVWRNSFRHRSH